jgi:hypothetical protein
MNEDRKKILLASPGIYSQNKLLAYDSFTRVDGPLGTSETTGPGGRRCPAKAWDPTVGVWGIGSGMGQCSGLVGGMAMATVPIPVRDIDVRANVARMLGQVGLVTSFANKDNCIIGMIGDSNAILGKMVGGIWTALVTEAYSYFGDAILRIIVQGTQVRMYFNGIKIGTTQTVSDAAILAVCIQIMISIISLMALLFIKHRRRSR